MAIVRKKSLELKKHVAAIHSTNKLSLLQRKIANGLLFNAYEELLTKDEHSIHIATLCNLIGYDSNDHKTIKKALVKLLATVIEWNLVDGSKLDEEGIWNASSIIADASIDGPVCTYSYSNKMKNLLYRPELYGRLNMLVQAKFQSTYGLALYENCIRYQSIEQTPWFDILQFRKLMGVADGKYKIFRDFKTRVIDKAVEEVNKFSPVKVKPNFRKHGRQVVSIQFAIQSNTKEERKEPLAEDHLLKRLKGSFGLSKRQIEEVLASYSTQYINEKIMLIESSPSYQQGKITYLAKYLLCALKDDYQINKKSQKTQKSSKNINIQEVDAYRHYQHKGIMQIFNRLKAVKQKTLLIKFEKFLGNSMYKDIYLRDKMKNILIQDQLCLFIKQHYPDLITALLTFEEFCEQSR